MTLETPTITVVDPSTGRELAAYAEHGPEQIEVALAAAHAAYRSWRESSLGERAQLLTALAGSLRADREKYAALITSEVGKPLAEARAELEKCAVGLRVLRATWAPHPRRRGGRPTTPDSSRTSRSA